jgi:two-component system chemotaxis response regulator CheY
LIVDDDFVNRSILNDYLSRFGAVDSAVNGKEALFAVTRSFELKSPYDLICLDIILPELNGEETLDGIRQLEKKFLVNPGRRIKVFMVTIVDGAPVIERNSLKYEAYLIKPVNLNELHEKLLSNKSKMMSLKLMVSL